MKDVFVTELNAMNPETGRVIICNKNLSTVFLDSYKIPVTCLTQGKIDNKVDLKIVDASTTVASVSSFRFEYTDDGNAKIFCNLYFKQNVFGRTTRLLLESGNYKLALRCFGNVLDENLFSIDRLICLDLMKINPNIEDIDVENTPITSVGSM